MNIKRSILGFVTAALCVMTFASCSSSNVTYVSRESSAEDSASGSSSNSSSGNGDSSAAESTGGSEASQMVVNAPATGGNVGDVTIKSGDIVAEFEIDGFGTIKAKLFPDIAPIGVQNFVQLAQDRYFEGKNIHRVLSDFMLQGGSENGDGTGGSAAYSGEGSSSDSFGIEVDNNARHFYGALCYANAMGRNSTQFYIVNSKQAQDLDSVSADEAKQTAELAKTYKESCTAGTTEYSYYEAIENQYRNLADMLENATSEIKEKYKQGGVYYLDGGYTVFGQVVEGFDVIDNISAVEVKENSGGEKSQPVKNIIIKSVKVYTAE